MVISRLKIFRLSMATSLEFPTGIALPEDEKPDGKSQGKNS
jgi:hypothetical protein